ncbi:Cyclin N-terminal domain-containing protein [Heracleum sosnowskyi]|uniref:Cyclin N-terminal domain-containing protein n=1 Tax=Heracleum sosnowskyi TaxID=360622 RepID=A0AAD8IPM4_9APIA|nr:Cyclin N-terminal domain-containing protein [Heracleum sosnowskyi]KAK1389361.1 Cyclin N-terminal domain-containing protein [Heracleum sosnowskyi]
MYRSLVIDRLWSLLIFQYGLPALANITNQRNGPPVNSTNSSKLLSGPAKGENCKKGTSTRNANVGYRASNMPAPTFLKPCTSVSNKNSTTFTSCDGTFSRKKAPYAQFNMDTSSIKSDCLSVALDGSMSSSESLKSPEVEYIDNTDVEAIDSIERKTYNKLCISDDGKTAGSICKRDILAEMETGDRIVDVDENSMDPQLCATLACDIYKHLRASEVKKRPSTDFMETVQKDINASMRAILVDWLVEVSRYD